MICMVLAAGYATRLYPLTEHFPKPLLDVGGKPILNWLLDDIDQLEGIEEHVIMSNHKFIRHFEEWKEKQHYTHPIRLLDDGSKDNEHRLGAVRDMELAVKALGSPKDTLVIAGDNVLDFSFREFLRFGKEKGTSCVMCHEEKDLKKQQKTAIITVDEEQLITDGCGVDAPGSFAAWLSRKVAVHAWKMTGKRYDIGDQESYERVREKFGIYSDRNII